MAGGVEDRAVAAEAPGITQLVGKQRSVGPGIPIPGDAERQEVALTRAVGEIGGEDAAEEALGSAAEPRIGKDRRADDALILAGEPALSGEEGGENIALELRP